MNTHESSMPALYSGSRVFTTPTVARWGRPNERRKYNYPLPTDVLEQLDPEGLHVSAMPSFLHEAGRHAKATTVRTVLLLKLLDQEQPLELFVDVPLDDWNPALSVEQVTAVLDAERILEASDAAA